MKTPLAFLSFDVKLSEADALRLIEGIASCPEPFNVDDWSTERRAPREDWDKDRHSKIGRCDFMIVLVAKGMDQAPVVEEILEARRCNVPFFGVYLGAKGRQADLPPGLPRNRMVPFEWEPIAKAVRQVCKEGKHHTFA